jgi:hypothetical protein
MEEFEFPGTSASAFAEMKLARVDLTLHDTVDLASNSAVNLDLLRVCKCVSHTVR